MPYPPPGAECPYIGAPPLVQWSWSIAVTADSGAKRAGWPQKLKQDREKIGTSDGNDSDFRIATLEHDPEKWKPVFPRDKRETRLRGDHAQTKG
jgi:hypothetical protein